MLPVHCIIGHIKKLHGGDLQVVLCCKKNTVSHFKIQGFHSAGPNSSALTSFTQVYRVRF